MPRCNQCGNEQKPSKFGGFWCPDCYHQKKGTNQQPAGNNEYKFQLAVMDELKAINDRLDTMAEWLVKNVKQ